MASTIRVRATASGETTEVQALIQHPMDSGFVKDSKGQIIPAHHIEVVQFEHGGKTVFTAQWGPAVSKDPYLKFSFKGAKKLSLIHISLVPARSSVVLLGAHIAAHSHWAARSQRQRRGSSLPQFVS